MKRCSRCVMPESVPGITFDATGTCSFCQTYKPETYLGRELLDREIRKTKKGAGKYECIVPVSGGRDSAYVLYYVVTELKLRALACHWDNGFDTDYALRNLRAMCANLGVDLHVVRSRHNTAKNIVLHRMRHSLRKDLASFPNSFCWACNFGGRGAVRQAVDRFAIPLLFMGTSKGEATQSMETAVTPRQKKMILTKITSPDFIRYELERNRLKKEFPIASSRGFDRGSTPSMESETCHVIALFDYIQWDRREIKSVIFDKLGWRAPHGAISTWKIDCYFNTLTNYCYIKRFGCTKTCFGYTKFINAGTMTRDEALTQEEAYLRFFEDFEPVREILRNKVGLSHDEVEEVRKLGPA